MCSVMIFIVVVSLLLKNQSHGTDAEPLPRIFGRDRRGGRFLFRNLANNMRHAFHNLRHRFWIPFLCAALTLATLVAVSFSATAQEKSHLVQAAYDERGNFFLKDIQDGTRVAEAPGCLSKEFIARYPDYPQKVKVKVACANVRGRGSVLEQQSALADAGLSVIAWKKRLLEKTRAELAAVTKLDGLTEMGGVLMPRGIEESRSIEGALFSGQCVLDSAGAPTQAEPIGPRRPAFAVSDVFLHSSEGVDRALVEELPKVIDEYNDIEEKIRAIDAEPTSNIFVKVKRAAQKKIVETKWLSLGPQILAHAANYMAVPGKVLASEASSLEKELIARGASGLGQVVGLSIARIAGSCGGGNESRYTVSVGNKHFEGCFEDAKTLAMIRGKTDEKTAELLKEQGKFEAEKRSADAALARLKTTSQSCF